MSDHRWDEARELYAYTLDGATALAEELYKIFKTERSQIFNIRNLREELRPWLQSNVIDFLNLAFPEEIQPQMESIVDSNLKDFAEQLSHDIGEGTADLDTMCKKARDKLVNEIIEGLYKTLSDMMDRISNYEEKDKYDEEAEQEDYLLEEGDMELEDILGGSSDTDEEFEPVIETGQVKPMDSVDVMDLDQHDTIDNSDDTGSMAVVEVIQSAPTTEEPVAAEQDSQRAMGSLPVRSKPGT